MADMRTYRVEVTQTMEVTLDAEKFDDAFMQEFRGSFYNFDTLAEHAEHIAQLQAHGLIDVSYQSRDFIEGYGEHQEMGITAKCLWTVISDAAPTNPEDF